MIKTVADTFYLSGAATCNDANTIQACPQRSFPDSRLYRDPPRSFPFYLFETKRVAPILATSALKEARTGVPTTW